MTRFLFLSHDNKIGDAIVLTGVFSRLKAAQPQCTIGVICGRANAYIYQNHRAVDEVVVTRSRSLLARVASALRARWQGYDLLVHFGSDVNSRSLQTLVHWAHPGSALIFFQPDKPLLAQQCVLPGDWQGLHISERHRAFLNWIGVETPSYDYQVLLPDAALHQASQWMRSTGVNGLHVVIACDGSTADRSLSSAWLETLCLALVGRMDAALDITLLCLGSARRRELSLLAQILEHSGCMVRLAPSGNDLGLALALIARADIVVSPDTFAVHAACAFRTPVVALYPGNTHTLVSWAPLGTAAQQLVAPANQGLSALDPDAVAIACQQLLQQSEGSSTHPPSSAGAEL